MKNESALNQRIIALLGKATEAQRRALYIILLDMVRANEKKSK